MVLPWRILLRRLRGIRDKFERSITAAESVTRAARDDVKRRVGIVCAIINRAVATVSRVILADCSRRAVGVRCDCNDQELRSVGICAE